MFILNKTFLDSADDPNVGLEVFLTEFQSNNQIKYSFTQSGNLLSSKDPLVTDVDGNITCYVHDADGCRIRIYEDGNVVFQEDYLPTVVETANIKLSTSVAPVEPGPVTVTAIRLLPTSINAVDSIEFDVGVVVIYSDGTYDINPGECSITPTGSVIASSKYVFASSDVGGTMSLIASIGDLDSNSVTVTVNAGA